MTIEKTEKVLFRVVGMYCVSCKSIVEKQLKKEQAVKKLTLII
ncbi:MAG TPA: cation transporter [Nitrososphaeraceae archaeon]|nr:cation transporter [Nitrososphaeraceae archaeon]